MSDTPETEKLRERIVALYKQDECTADAMGDLLLALPDIEALERQRDAYAETLRHLCVLAHPTLAKFIRKRHPELANRKAQPTAPMNSDQTTDRLEVGCGDLVRLFVPRSVFARRYGIYGASMLPLGSIYGGRMPAGIKVACLIDGELREARYGETTHREICQREAIPGSVIVEGFSLPNTPALPPSVGSGESSGE